MTASALPRRNPHAQPITAPGAAPTISEISGRHGAIPTPYADALTKQARIDYETSSDESTAVDEIKLSRAMTMTALRTSKYTQARAWQQTLSTVLRIQLKAEGLDGDRQDVINVVATSADARRRAIACGAEDSQPSASADPNTLSLPSVPIATSTTETHEETN
jgi:hypothetical protein